MTNIDISTFTDKQKEILDYITIIIPFNLITKKEWFVYCITLAYSPDLVLTELKKISGYCAGNPEWAIKKKSWNKTVYNWIKRTNENLENSIKVKSLFSVKSIPIKENSQKNKVETLIKLNGV